METAGEIIEQILTEMRQVREEVSGLREDIRQTKGFIGGVMWCLSGLAAMAGFIWGILS